MAQEEYQDEKAEDKDSLERGDSLQEDSKLIKRSISREHSNSVNR